MWIFVKLTIFKVFTLEFKSSCNQICWCQRKYFLGKNIRQKIALIKWIKKEMTKNWEIKNRSSWINCFINLSSVLLDFLGIRFSRRSPVCMSWRNINAKFAFKFYFILLVCHKHESTTTGMLFIYIRSYVKICCCKKDRILSFLQWSLFLGQIFFRFHLLEWQWWPQWQWFFAR